MGDVLAIAEQRDGKIRPRAALKQLTRPNRIPYKGKHITDELDR